MPAATAATEMPAATAATVGSITIRLTNLKRNRWNFPLPKEIRALDRFDGVLVIGDAKDHDGSDTLPAEAPRHPKLQPNPVVTLTGEEWDALPEEVQRVINEMVSKGQLTKAKV